ncbi:hypothetical protein [Nocardioides aurantiacus]|uniref:PH (Pleckstrin Homology) domain-containing protein n=1 Tax=Nocardioides aurantiacus TaxID=86796 RepID=A0A3N2CX44_9ACTN|nr:hypothetical protein [Nocardioides aurantiacus]ROR92069.1 hypothetical protein EDD33_2953 [Nocardioides aurantiacus]
MRVPDDSTDHNRTSHQTGPTTGPTTGPGHPTAPVRRAEWTAPDHGRAALTLLLVMAVAGCAVLALRGLTRPSPAHLAELGLGVLVTLAVALAVLASAPRVVRVHGTVVSLHRGRRQHRFDLADAAVVAELSGRPTDPAWSLLLRDGAAGVEVTVRRREVDAFALDGVVRHHRSAAGVVRPVRPRTTPRLDGLDGDGHRRSA